MQIKDKCSEISFNSSFFNHSIDSKNSFLKNELQEVLQKNLGKGNFLQQLIQSMKQIEDEKIGSNSSRNSQ